MSRFRTIGPKFAAAGMMLWCAAATALAQADIVRPPKAEDPEDVSFPLTLGVAVLCIGVVVGLNLMPSRRTHQD